MSCVFVCISWTPQDRAFRIMVGGRSPASTNICGVGMWFGYVVGSISRRCSLEYPDGHRVSVEMFGCDRVCVGKSYS
jgi:hypothetical protein